ncbi:MAG: hypothetical protein PVJ64_03950 [Gemmatimonadales bacterium]|jgi:hypothetical protein
MLEIQERSEVQPLCPHCERALRTVWYRQLKGMFGRRYLYFCSECHKVLGISHRKGFWMG